MPRSSLPVALACLIGALGGNLLARPVARAAEPAVIGADDAKEAPKNSCSCPKTVCTRPDGLRSMDGACEKKCAEGQTPDCQCGACGEDGALEKRNTCRCKSG